MAAAIAAEEYYTHIKEDGRVAAFLGPSCSGLMRGVAELSAVWGIPVLSGLTTSISVSEKQFFKTLTRSTMILSDGYGRVVESLVCQFQWRTVAWLWLGTGFQNTHVSAGKNSFDEIGVIYREIITQNFESTKLALENAITSARGGLKTIVNSFAFP